MSVGHPAHLNVRNSPMGGYGRRQSSSRKDAIVVAGGRRSSRFESPRGLRFRPRDIASTFHMFLFDIRTIGFRRTYDIFLGRPHFTIIFGTFLEPYTLNPVKGFQAYLIKVDVASIISP